MTRAEERERYLFASTIQAEFSLTQADAFDTTRALTRAARSLHRIAERICSVEMSDAETARVDRREASILRAVGSIAARLGTSIVCQRDPRGPMLRLVLPSGNGNGWSGEGWCVPE